jgi:DNA-binding CsgD family transcriptional regulator
MSEVLIASEFLAFLGDVAQIGGIPVPAVLLDRRSGPARTGDAPTSPVSWDGLTAALEHLASAAGGYWALERLCYRAVVVHPQMRNAASLFPSVRELYLAGLDRLSRRLLRGLGQRAEALPDGRYRFELRIPGDRADCPALAYVHHATLRAYPRLFGLPDPMLTLEVASRRAVYHATLTEERRRTAERLARTSTPRPRHGLSAAEVESMPPGQELLPLLADPGLAAEVADLGHAWLAAGSVALLAQALYRFLEERFCCDRLRLWLTGGRGAEDVLVFSRGDAAAPLPWQHPLVAGDRTVGALAADVACFPAGQPPPLLEAALPWIGLALEQTLRKKSSPLPGAQSALDLRPLIARRAAEWQLTARETEALALLVDGQSNRQIAEAMGCSPKTVEAHVSQVLRKAGVPGRSALVSCLLERT